MRRPTKMADRTGNTEQWILSVEEDAEAQKLLSLRDKALAECTPTQSKRLQIEKRVRSNYKDNCDYKKHIRNGRYDLIPKHLRDCIFTSQQALEHAYYDNYKPRAERYDTHTEHEPSENQVSAKSNTDNEGFYEDTVSSTPEGLGPPAYESSQHTLKSTDAQLQVSSQSSLEQDQQGINPTAFPVAYNAYTMPYVMSYPPGAVPQAQYQAWGPGGATSLPTQPILPQWGMMTPQQIHYMQQMAHLQGLGGAISQPQQQPQGQEAQQHKWSQQNGNKDLQPY